MLEEYKGITRSEFPAWQGWKIIEEYAKTNVDAHVMVQLCENNVELQELADQFHQGNTK